MPTDLRATAIQTAIGAVETKDEDCKDVACKVAQVTFWDARAEFQRYKNLIYWVACLIVISLVASVVLFAAGKDTRAAGLVSFLGTVASCGALAWVLARKNHAEKEDTAAAKLVKDYCGTQATELQTHLDSGARPEFLS
jgi:hypothetical protein